jgi:hypothetical protein
MASDYRATWHDEFARCHDCGHATVGLSLPYAINHPADCAASGFDVAPPYEDPLQLACRERDEARQQLADALGALKRAEGQRGELLKAIETAFRHRPRSAGLQAIFDTAAAIREQAEG